MKYLYIAGPYTNGDPVVNTRNAIRTADVCMACGYVPFVPHLSLQWHMVRPHSLDFWYQYDLCWLERCDALLRIPGESIGADREVARAKELGLPVYYGIENLP